MSRVARSLRAQLLWTPDGSSLVHEPDAWLAWDDHGRLIAVERWSGQRIDADLRPSVLTPGFVDSHVHYPQTRAIGRASGTLLDWLEQSIFPEEARFVDADYAHAVADEFMENSLRNGTTAAFAYGPAFAEATDTLFARAEARGLRLLAGPALMERDAPAELCIEMDTAFAGLDGLRLRWHGRGGGRLRVAVIPRFALSCDPPMLARAGAYAREHDLFVGTHLGETTDEYAEACRRFAAADYLEVYERFGLVHGKSVYAHCIHLTSGEWERLARSEAIVAHCPDSNAFLGSGSMPVSQAMSNGIRVTLGSDVAAGRQFSMPAHGSQAFDNGLRDGMRLPLTRIFGWMTTPAARDLGFASGAGLRVGAPADLVEHELEGGDAETLLAQLLFAPEHRRVRRVWVDGHLRWGEDLA